MGITIYHNPRCSKSRQTLALLEDRGITPAVIEYLVNPPSVQELTDLLDKMGKKPQDIVRRKEAREEGIDLESDDATIIQALVAHPRALERPIVVNGSKAAMGRPPESVLTIL